MNKAGVITDVGNSIKNKTGGWRIFRPKVIDKCTGCGICIKFCPDACIEIRNKKAKVDYDFCKGCLICLKVCPFKAIEKEKEIK